MDEVFEKGLLTGGDIFSVTVERDIDNVEELLEKCYERFKLSLYRDRFEWIDNIKEVRSVGEKEKLDEALLNLIDKKNFTNVWMAIPEVISWEAIKYFKYDGSQEECSDIYVEKVIETFKSHITDINQLKNKKIVAISAEDENRIQYRWSAYKCIIAEIDVDKKSYCLNNGKWYKIDNSFAKRVNDEYKTLTLSSLSFIPYDSKGNTKFSEDDYNDEVAKSFANARLLHKTGEIPYGGGSGNKIEVCDVMTLDKTFIHIKKNGGSAVLSHLFNQAAVSAEAMIDLEFRTKFNQKLADYKYNELIDDSFLTASYKVVIAIINETNDERPKIPFFSKVAIRYTTKAISNLGYIVELKNIYMV